MYAVIFRAKTNELDEEYKVQIVEIVSEYHK